MTSIGVFAAVFDDHRRILCVKQNYGSFRWSLPGGALERGEDPISGVVREVYEETGYRVRCGDLVGVYSAPHKDDLVIFFEVEILSKDDDWYSDGEIAAIGFFAIDELPDLSNRARRRVLDAYEGKRGVMHVFSPGD